MCKLCACIYIVSLPATAVLTSLALLAPTGASAEGQRVALVAIHRRRHPLCQRRRRPNCHRRRRPNCHRCRAASTLRAFGCPQTSGYLDVLLAWLVVCHTALHPGFLSDRSRAPKLHAACARIPHHAYSLGHSCAYTRNVRTDSDTNVKGAPIARMHSCYRRPLVSVPRAPSNANATHTHIDTCIYMHTHTTKACAHFLLMQSPFQQ